MNWEFFKKKSQATKCHNKLGYKHTLRRPLIPRATRDTIRPAIIGTDTSQRTLAQLCAGGLPMVSLWLEFMLERSEMVEIFRTRLVIVWDVPVAVKPYTRPFLAISVRTGLHHETRHFYCGYAHHRTAGWLSDSSNDQTVQRRAYKELLIVHCAVLG